MHQSTVKFAFTMVSGFCLWTVLHRSNRAKKISKGITLTSNKENAADPTVQQKKKKKKKETKIAPSTSMPKGTTSLPAVSPKQVQEANNQKTDAMTEVNNQKTDEIATKTLAQGETAHKTKKDIDVPDILSVGTSIAIKGLKGGAQYNGKHGTIWNAYNVTTGRYGVKLDDGGKELAVRPGNLIVRKLTIKKESAVEKTTGEEDKSKTVTEEKNAVEKKTIIEEAETQEVEDKMLITFQPGRLGITYQGNLIFQLDPAGQAASLGVELGWKIVNVDNIIVSDDTDNITEAINKAKETNKPYTMCFCKAVTLVFKPERFGIKFLGNVITSVHAATQAQTLGVRKGWKILTVNGIKQPDNTELIAQEMERTKKHGQITVIEFQKGV